MVLGGVKKVLGGEHPHLWEGYIPCRIFLLRSAICH